MKKFLVIGNMNAITYKEIFPLIKENKMWTGFKHFGGGMNMIQNKETFDESKTKSFSINENGEIIKNIMGCIWFTNLEHNKRHEKIDLYKHYNSEEYPKYDNYDAINVDKTCEIPMDYYGSMGVPITFIDKYCPEQFEIIGLMSGVKHDVFINGDDGRAKFYINGKGVYARILIRIKK